jgi:DNA-binding transcriptional LysR family regulator
MEGFGVAIRREMASLYPHRIQSDVMDKFESMTAFVKVVSLGSYAEAGRSLGLTRSAVSKAVMELERLLGARLLERTTRRIRPTEAGLAYYERCADILALVEETELQVSRLHDEPKGVLKVNAPMSFGIRYLGGIVARFMTLYPELRVELTLTDRFINPLEEGVDVTVRIGALADSSLIARKLAPARRALVASAAYLAERGEPQALTDLTRHRCLSYGHTTMLQRWQLRDGDAIVSIPITSCLCSNNGDVLREAALNGNGIAKLPDFLIGSDIKSGAVRVVLPNHPPTELGIYALYAPNRYLAAKTRVFVDFLVAQLGGSTRPWEAIPADGQRETGGPASAS